MSSLSAVDLRFYKYALMILSLMTVPSIIDPYIVIFRMSIQVRSSYPGLALRKNEIYVFWSQIPMLVNALVD